MTNTINELIEKYQCETRTSSSIVLKQSNNVPFNIKEGNVSDFYGHLCDSTANEAKHEKGIRDISVPPPNGGHYNHLGHTLTEVAMNDIIPFSFDTTLKFRLGQEGKKGLVYNEDFVTSLVYVIQHTLATNLEIGHNLNIISNTVEISGLWSDNEFMYIRVVLFFPFCRVNVECANDVLIEACIKNLSTSAVQNNLEYEMVNGWRDSIRMHTNEVPIYMSKLTPNSAPPRYQYMYAPLAGDNINDITHFRNKAFNNIFDPLNSMMVANGIISKAILSKDVEMENWYTLVRSIHYAGGEVKPKRVTPVNIEQEGKGPIEYGSDVTSGKPKDMIINLMPLLNGTRYATGPFWNDICQCVYNTFAPNDHARGKALLIKHAAGHKTRQECEEAYMLLNDNHLTVKTIAGYAKDDNPERYEEWHQAWATSTIFEATSLLHDHVAAAVYRVLWLDHVWVGGKRWMVFEGHGLREQQNCCNIRRDITDIIVPKYRKMKKGFQNAAAEGKTPSDVKLSEEIAKKVQLLINKLSDHGYKSTVIKAAETLFEVVNFNSIKDSDYTKTGWKNCVLTCSGNHAYASNGKLEDYITKSTYSDYRKDFTWDNPLVKELQLWFRQMFPDSELLEYITKDMASYLYGRNSEKLLRAWCGDGNNSKTMLAKCIQMAFGSYCIDFPANFLTAKSLGNGPNPELAQAQGAHVGFVPETEDDEKIREGAAKRATGGDRQFARNCNENGGPMEMGCKVILLCNKIPEFTSISKALIARFENLPFLSNWSMSAPKTIEEQTAQNHYLMDPFFENRLPVLSQALAWIAVQYYPIYKRDGLKRPAIVERYTKKHWEDNDPVLCFVNDRIESTYINNDEGKKIPNPADNLSCSQIYTVFKTWFGQRYPGTTPVSQTSFQVNLILQLGKPNEHNKKWSGVSIIQMAAAIPTESNGGNNLESMNI